MVQMSHYAGIQNKYLTYSKLEKLCFCIYFPATCFNGHNGPIKSVDDSRVDR